MRSTLRNVLVILFFFVLASCGGQGCSSREGMTPLPGGFPKDKTVDNAAGVRISRPGFDVIEKSLPSILANVVHLTDGKFTFDVPETDAGRTILVNGPGTWGDVSAEIYICNGDPKDGRCKAEIGLGTSTFQIDAITPNALRVRGVIPIKLSDTPVRASVDPGSAEPVVHVGYGDGSCNGSTPNVTPHALPVVVTIPLIPEPTAPRTGYTKVDVDNAVLDLSALSSNELKVCSGCSGIDFCNDILNSGFVKNKVLGALKSNLEGKFRNILRSELCTEPSAVLEPACPIGSSPDDANAVCVFDSNKSQCVPALLGMDAHVNLGKFLAKISPTTSGGLDFGLAAGGAMKPLPGAADDAQGRSPNGATLGMIGGVVPQPPSPCVPQAALSLPTGIALPDELAPKKLDDASTPHVGVALAGRFLEYALGGVYNSGTLCLDVTTEQFAMLKSSLLSLVIPSIKTLTFEQGDASAAVTTRPQAPPRLELGQGTDTDPLITITLPKFAIDFYVWHLERYVRAFTFEGDLTVPLNLQTGKTAGKSPDGGIVPVIGDVRIENAVVTNADLLTDDPVAIAKSLSDLIGGLAKQLLGDGFSPFDLSSALSSFGVGVDVTQIRKLTKGQDDFVGIFANLSTTKKSSLVLDTQIALRSKTVHPDRMQLATYTRDALPELVVEAHASADGDDGGEVEYAWWIDDGSRSAWSTNARDATWTIKDTQLLLQGKHVLHMVDRQKDRPETEDPSPADLPFVIDALAPFVTLKTRGSNVTVDAWDLVSSKEALVARYRLDDADFGEFQPLSELATIDVGTARTVEVEVKDEEGNVRSTRQALSGEVEALVARGSGCGCSTPRTTDGNGIASIAVVALGLGLVVARRRRRSRVDVPPPTARVVQAMALGSVVLLSTTNQGCSSGRARGADTGCGQDCNQACLPPLPLGTPGAYTSVAKASNGAIWVAGYNDALLDQGRTQPWGDLVVGKYDLGKKSVAWTTVDGIPERPAGTCADRDASTWRRGEIDAGDDVGLWTSIQLSASDRPMVSYYDATNHRLKLAVNDDAGWTTTVLDEVPGGDVGRYSKMLVKDGRAVLVYPRSEPGNDGRTRTRIVLARAQSELPHGPQDFTFEEIAVQENDPCGPHTCPSGSACLDDGTCAAIATCTPECGAGSICVNQGGEPRCRTTIPLLMNYPNVFGDYLALANGPKGLAVALYDRPNGNLVVLTENGAENGRWKSIVVDGETGDRAEFTDVDTGDVGVGCALAIDDAGTLHLSYLRRDDATLRYVTVKDDKPGPSLLVDDGSGLDGNRFSDGRHFVGDDTDLRVDATSVSIFYQDATLGVLRRAVGTSNGPSQDGMAWSLRAVPQDGKFAGFFPRNVPGEDSVANFFRETDRATKSVRTDVAVVAP